MSRNLLKPFNTVLKIALVSESPVNCSLVHDLMGDAFDSARSFLNNIGNVSYSRKEELFKLVIHKELEIRFSVHYLVCDFMETVDFSSYDIVFPVIDLTKYAAYEYNRIPIETQQVLRQINKADKSFSILYLHAESLFADSIGDANKWELALDSFYHIVLEGIDENDGIKLSLEGREILKGLFKVFNFYSRQQELFEIVSKINLLVSDGAPCQITFGKEEFIANLLIQLVRFDKLNNYHYQI